MYFQTKNIKHSSSLPFCMGKIHGMVEANIEDLAFLSRPQGEPASPVGHECLSTGRIKRRCTRLLDSLKKRQRVIMRSSGTADEGGEGMALKI